MNNINCLNTPQNYSFADSMNTQQQSRFSMMSQSSSFSQQLGGRRMGFSENYRYNMGMSNGINPNNSLAQYNQQMNNPGAIPASNNMNFNNFGRQRFAPYHNKRSTYANAVMQQPNHGRFYSNQLLQVPLDVESSSVSSETALTTSSPTDSINSTSSQASNTNNGASGTAPTSAHSTPSIGAQSTNSTVTLQISNLDTTIEESQLKQYLISRLKPITTVLSIYFEGLSVAKIKLPSDHHAKQVISFLHRKKIGHKRVTVSYSKESSTLEPSTLRCQVAGLLKDIPNYKLSMYKFRELFQSRFKTSISVVDLYEMKDICTIIESKNEDKYISLRSELIDSIADNSELMECFQHSVPYCTQHFVKTHRGWAEQEIDPLPNVQMTIAQVRTLLYALLKNHKGVIPIASIVHCIQSDLNVSFERNESGVNFEHLISCVQGVQITSNKFSIKTLNWASNAESSPKEKDVMSDDVPLGRYSKYGNIPDSFTQVSREIVELVKMSPKSTLKFSRFIPAYHNHFGKQCRVADYGYTKLIDLFEALSSVVQVMGEGENRQITLTHKVQMQRFKTDLLRILRTSSSKSIYLSHLPSVFEQVQGKKFNITDYGVCDVNDILDGLVNTNAVVVNSIPHMMDTIISIPKRKQSATELEKTSNFAAEVVELFKHASQFTILFEKFACSYHYHFGYQCRLSDYGYMKLADLMEGISGIVEMEFSNEEDRKIFLSPKASQRIFSEQLKSLIESFSGSSDTMTNLHEVLAFHKKQYGYQIMPQSLGFDDMHACVKALPYIEVVTLNGFINIICHHDDQLFRQKCYAACRLLLDVENEILPLSNFVKMFSDKFSEVLNDRTIKAMKHAIEVQYVNDVKCITISPLLKFIIHIINVIEQRGTVKLQDITTTLKLSMKACFPFGYPNLWTLIQAFPDIFVVAAAKQTGNRAEIQLNGQCILTKEGYSNYMKFVTDNNNSSVNNNEAGVLDYNVFRTSPNRADDLSLITSAANDISASMSCQPLMSQSSSYQGSSVSESYLVPMNEMNIHPAYENINTFSSLTSCNSNTSLMDTEGQYPLHSTKLSMNDSGELSNFSGQRSFNMSNGSTSDGQDNASGYGSAMNSMEKQMSGYSYSEANPFANEYADELQRTMKRKEMNISRKHISMSEPLKPDTPPFPSNSQQSAPYWADPIWTKENVSPAGNVSINLPDLKVFHLEPKLNTPEVMASIAKKSRMFFVDSEKNN